MRHHQEQRVSLHPPGEIFEFNLKQWPEGKVGTAQETEIYVRLGEGGGSLARRLKRLRLVGH